MKSIQVVTMMLAAAWILASCADTQSLPTPGETLPPVVIAATLAPTDPAIPTPDLPVTPVRTQYELTAILDYPARQLEVDGTVVYTNHSSIPLTDLVLVVEPNLTPGVFELESLTWDDGTQVEGETLARHRLTLPLRQPLLSGEDVRVRFNYTLIPPAKAGVLCFNDAQVNLAGWYPYTPPYINGEGWLVHDPGKVGEYQVYELADFEVNIRVDNAPEGFMVAAGARAEYDEGWYHFNQSAARNFTWSGSSNYQMLETYAGEVRVRAFVFPNDLSAGEAALESTAQALAYYTTIYGPYEHDSMTLIEAGFADGMEYDGLSFVGQEYFKSYNGGAANYLTTITVHETAHQWWFGMVMNDQAEEPWLDEALCTYSELLYYENFHPDEVGWWWLNRVNYYDPAGNVDSTVYDFSAFRPYVNAVYLRGAQLLDELRVQVGDELFAVFLRTYFAESRQKAVADPSAITAGEDFWRILGEIADVDHVAVKDKYFAQP